MTKDHSFPDGFRNIRPKTATRTKLDGESMPMLLGWHEVRRASRDWKTFSSDAPFRIPIPSEESVRTVRQMPIETNPPVHTEIRGQLDLWFRRPKEKSYLFRLEQLIKDQIDAAKSLDNLDLVRDFALPLQSRALALLLDMPQEEADIWIGWGTHVFNDGADPAGKGSVLESYIQYQIRRARQTASDDFFAALTQMTLEGQALSDDQMAGIANLVFAGGRDTLINVITTLCVLVGTARKDFEGLLDDERQINLAVEELFRVTSPLTHIGRVCPAGASVEGEAVMPNGRVSLCWAAANYDPEVFANPEKLILDRSPNPHIAFGSGPHNCMGAPQARAILRLLLKRLCIDTNKIKIISVERNLETLGLFQRCNGYLSAIAKIS